MIGGALAGIPTVLFAVGHSLTAGIITLIVFLTYQQIENHVLQPLVYSRTVQLSPLAVLRPGEPNRGYERHRAAHPHALLFRRSDLVPDAFAGDLPLELGE